MNLVASLESEVLSVDSAEYDGEAMCTYHVSLPESAGPGDIMTIEFLSSTRTSVGYGTGTNYTNANFDKMEEPAG